MDETCLPQTLWRQISSKQCLKETGPKKIFEEKIYQKYLNIKLHQKYLKIKFYPNIRRHILHQTICEGKLSTKQTLNRNLFQTNSNKKPLPKNKGRNMPTKKSLKRHLYEKISEEKSLPRKHFKQFLYQNFPHKIIPRKLWRDVLQTKKKIHLYQKVSLETSAYQKKVWRNISTKKVLEKDPYPQNEETSPPKNLNKSEQEAWQKSEAMKKGFIRFLQFRFLPYCILLSYCFWHAPKLKLISWKDLIFNLYVVWTCIWVCVILCWIDLSKSCKSQPKQLA